MNALPLLRRTTALFMVALTLSACDGTGASLDNSGTSSRKTKVWVKANPAIAAPSWEARALIHYSGDRLNYPGEEQGLIEMFTDPGGKKKWQRYLERNGAREITGGTEAWVVDREGDFRAIQFGDDETVWWVHKAELERPWGRK